MTEAASQTITKEELELLMLKAEIYDTGKEQRAIDVKNQEQINALFEEKQEIINTLEARVSELETEKEALLSRLESADNPTVDAKDEEPSKGDE